MSRLVSLGSLLALAGCIENSISSYADAVGNSDPPDLEAETRTDRIVQVTVQAVDVLWVIDNSCSMQDEQNSLTANFPSFMTYFTDSGLDYHVGVVSTDMDSRNDRGKLQPANDGSTYIDTSVGPDQAVTMFSQMAKLGTNGSGDERGLDATFAALETEVNGANAGFYREDATLSIITISDEEDHSTISTNEFISWLSAKKPSLDMTTYSFLGHLTNQCVQGLDEQVGSRYMKVVEAIGGIEWSICGNDWSDMLTELGLQAAGLKREFFLSAIPVEDTIEVVVRDADGTEWSFDEGTDWTYSRARNSVTFIEYIPEPLSEVLITYEVLASAAFQDEELDQ